MNSNLLHSIFDAMNIDNEDEIEYVPKMWIMLN